MMYFEKQGSGPPVVLVHGLGAYSFSWRDMLAALKGSHTTYAVDLVGFGQSPAPPGFANTMTAQADAVSAFIKTQSLVDPILIGHSMGGGISLRIAEQAGKNGQPNLNKMVLVAPVAYSPPKLALGPDLGELSKLLALPDFDPSQFSRQLASQILSQAYAKSSRVTSQQIDGYARGLSSHAQLRAFLEHSSKLGEIAVPAEKLAGIMVDTLIIWGEEDGFLNINDGYNLEKALGNASLQPIKDCGHIPQEEQPAETRKLIKAFL